MFFYLSIHLHGKRKLLSTARAQMSLLFLFLGHLERVSVARVCLEYLIAVSANKWNVLKKET